MIGRKMKGGRLMTSNAVGLAAIGVGLGVGLGLGLGDGKGDGPGEGEGLGDGAGAVSVKFAQGLGATLAHRWCTPSGSPAKGLTCAVNEPCESAVAEPATFVCWSQYSVTASPGRNWEPLTVIDVVESPAVTSRFRNAFGVGVGGGEGDGDACVVGVAVGLGESVRGNANSRGRATRSLSTGIRSWLG